MCGPQGPISCQPKECSQPLYWHHLYRHRSRCQHCNLLIFTSNNKACCYSGENVGQTAPARNTPKNNRFNHHQNYHLVVVHDIVSKIRAYKFHASRETDLTKSSGTRRWRWRWIILVLIMIYHSNQQQQYCNSKKHPCRKFINQETYFSPDFFLVNGVIFSLLLPCILVEAFHTIPVPTTTTLSAVNKRHSHVHNSVTIRRLFIPNSFTSHTNFNHHCTHSHRLTQTWEYPACKHSNRSLSMYRSTIHGEGLSASLGVNYLEQTLEGKASARVSSTIQTSTTDRMHNSGIQRASASKLYLPHFNSTWHASIQDSQEDREFIPSMVSFLQTNGSSEKPDNVAYERADATPDSENDLSYNSFEIPIDGANRSDTLSSAEMTTSPHTTNSVLSVDTLLNNDDCTTSTKHDISLPTPAGGFTHTAASRAKISAANKGKTPWNKGKSRSDEVKARIAEGVRRRNRERFLAQLAEEGITEEEYQAQKTEEQRKKEVVRKARRTEKGGYIPTEETKKKISVILKEKYASGDIVRAPRSPSSIRRGFQHTEETKQKIRESLRRKWAEDTEYREFMTKRTVVNNDIGNSPSVRKRIADTLKKKWQDEEFRAVMMDKFAKRKQQSQSKAVEHRQRISDAMKRKWMDEEYRKRAMEGMVKVRENSSPREQKAVRPKKDVVKKIKAAVPRLVSPMQPKILRELVPKKSQNLLTAATTTKKNSVVDKRIDRINEKKNSSSHLVAVKPIITSSTVIASSSNFFVDTKEPEGSIKRLRQERRDLYDLLYGDDDDDVIDDLENNNDVSTRSSILNGPSTVGNKKKRAHGQTLKGSKDLHNKPGLNDNCVDEPDVWATTSSKLASLMSDDDDLDDFDPYGLDDV